MRLLRAVEPMLTLPVWRASFWRLEVSDRRTVLKPDIVAILPLQEHDFSMEVWPPPPDNRPPSSGSRGGKARGHGRGRKGGGRGRAAPGAHPDGSVDLPKPADDEGGVGTDPGVVPLALHDGVVGDALDDEEVVEGCEEAGSDISDSGENEIFQDLLLDFGNALEDAADAAGANLDSEHQALVADAAPGAGSSSGQGDGEAGHAGGHGPAVGGPGEEEAAPFPPAPEPPLPPIIPGAPPGGDTNVDPPGRAVGPRGRAAAFVMLPNGCKISAYDGKDGKPGHFKAFDPDEGVPAKAPRWHIPWWATFGILDAVVPRM